ncbi:MAG: glycoside hydrolase family 2 TIM barrel-domain containing protein [Chitinophagales bacterium]
MKKLLSSLFFLILLPSLIHAQRIQNLFDSSWKFFRGDVINGEKQNINDKNWRTVELPHDWSIEDLPNQSDSVIGPFTVKSIGTIATGYTVGGTGWYRKHFKLNNIAGKIISICFDGVYMNADVWINEHHLGDHPYGYTPFYYDLTKWLKKNGEENIIAVRVRNEGKNTRWYSGSGIYRHVWLTITNPVHADQWGVAITTPKVSNDAATIRIKTTVVYEQDISPLKLRTKILDAGNKMVAIIESRCTNPSPLKRGWGVVTQNLQLSHPSLWSPESPYLYHAVTDVMQGDKILDRVTTTFGIRSIEVSSEKGFLLNGKSIELRGGCMHHDNGPLGSATIDRAEERRVELLKSFGFNAVRTSHNPPSQQFLDACDRLGILVLDEFTDVWEVGKNPDDYHLWFHNWWQRDLDAMLLRDRNHPSIIFWSIGNEIKERGDSPGLVIGKDLADEVHLIDPTRPVTEAICEFWDHPGRSWDSTARAFALLDVGGYNYQFRRYESDHEKYPQRIMMGTESVALEAYGNWQQVEKHPYVIGDFVWTAMDYLGETGIGHTALDRDTAFAKTWPWFNSWCGDIDLTGGKKPQSYYRDIVWKRSGINMLVHGSIPEGHKEVVSYWGWPDEVPSYTFTGMEGKMLKVNVYTSYPVVRLQLNGKTVAEKNVSSTDLTATFEINYQPGELKAIAIENNKTIDSVVLRTAGQAKQIHLIADRTVIKANRNDLCYVSAEITDDKGQLVPDALFPLHFTIEGNGEILATANANPSDMESFQQSQRKTFRGKALIIVRPKGKAGKIILKAESDGLKVGQLVIETK